MVTVNSVADFTIREGTTNPPIRATLIHDDGHVVDFSSGWLSITLVMARGVGQPPENELAATVIAGRETLPDDTELPNVEYDWNDDPTKTAVGTRGEYQCYWRVEWPDGTFSSFPSGEDRFTVEITPE